MFSYLCVTEFFNLNVYGNVIKRKKNGKMTMCLFVMFLLIQNLNKKTKRVVIKSVCRMPNKRCKTYHQCFGVLMRRRCFIEATRLCCSSNIPINTGGWGGPLPNTVTAKPYKS